MVILYCYNLIFIFLTFLLFYFKSCWIEVNSIYTKLLIIIIFDNFRLKIVIHLQKLINMQTFHSRISMVHFILRVPKKDSVLAYFILESHEGMCMFSTLDNYSDSANCWYRDIEVKATSDYREQLLAVITDLQKLMNIEVQEISSDSDNTSDSSNPVA